jgi:hypothetical protein
MNTPLDIMLGCKHCDEQVPPYDTADRTCQQWQCPHCKGWNHWMKFTETHEAVEPITPQGNKPKCVLCGHDDFYDDGICTMCGQNRNDPVTGNEGDDRVIDGQGNAPLPVGNYAMPPRYGMWDLRDEDGDVHSPAWYLDAFITARAEYLGMYDTIPQGDDEAMDKHIALMDDMLIEYELYGTYINRLFGSNMVEGVWNKSEDEDQ